MKTYWDSSALIKALHEPKLRGSLKRSKDGTRTHSLAEIFSALTKGLNFHYSPGDAAAMIESLAGNLDLIELNPAETVAAIKSARSQGVRGARIHDLMQAVAAEKWEASVILTMDAAGFSTLKISIPVQAP